MSEPTEVDRRHLDESLPIDERVEILLAQLTLPEKAGLFFHTMLGISDDFSVAEEGFSIASTEELVVERGITHFNVFGAAPSADVMVDWHNRLQQLAASTRLGIPITLSTDPRHSFSDNPLAAMLSGKFSTWPDSYGLAAIGDPELVRRFADVARQEYTAVGIRVALHPQVDLATEPRWARQAQTFGEDVELTSALGVAYVQGFQGGDRIGPDSVATMAKHFPGGGPQLDGEDPHFAYGREQVYPGGRMAEHLVPFRAVIDAGTSQLMPYYGMPVGPEPAELGWEPVGFAFNRPVITGLLREELGFDGIVCTDWGLITDSVIGGDPFPARAWGVEALTPAERMQRLLDAGCDQFGGESCVDLLIELVESGAVPESRLDVSARRLLREKFRLGLFDDRREVDLEHARSVVGRADFVAEGAAAQRASITVLTNRPAADGPVLPLVEGIRIYAEGVDAAVLGDYATVVATPGEAEVALLRLQAPFEQRATMFENFFHAGSLDFPADVVAHVREVASAVPTVVDVLLDRPAILTPFIEEVAACVANYGVEPQALLDVLFGHAAPRGRLPMDLPSSMAAVVASRPDVAHDTPDPLFRTGHGLEL